MRLFGKLVALGNTIEMEDCINKKIYFYLKIPYLEVIYFLTYY